MRLSKPFYLGSLTATYVLTLVIVVWSIVRIVSLQGLSGEVSQFEMLQLGRELIVEGLLLLLLFFALSVILLVLVYKMWAAIQDGHSRTTPGKAIGFLFIPFFGFYWLFQAWWGFAKDYNSYVKRHSLRAPELKEGQFLSLCILPFVAIIPFVGILAGLAQIIVLFLVVSSTCDAVNALPADTSGSLNYLPPSGMLGLDKYTGQPSLYCVSGEFQGHQLQVPREGLIIGRNPSRANLVLASDEVSATHIRLWSDSSNSGVWIEDMRSTNGTYYCESAGSRRRWVELRGRRLLSNGARFRIGSGVAEFEVTKA